MKGEKREYQEREDKSPNLEFGILESSKQFLFYARSDMISEARLSVSVRGIQRNKINRSYIYKYIWLPWWLRGKEFTCQCRRRGFDLWVGREDLLEEEMATHSSILAWKIPWTVELKELQSVGLQTVGRDWATEHAQTEREFF